MTQSTDLILCTMPPATLRAPAIGPALLMAAVRQKGFEALYYDFNFELYESLKSIPGIEEIFFWGGVFDQKENFDKHHKKYFHKDNCRSEKI